MSTQSLPHRVMTPADFSAKAFQFLETTYGRNYLKSERSNKWELISCVKFDTGWFDMWAFENLEAAMHFKLMFG